jgi:hypothetical protein
MKLTSLILVATIVATNAFTQSPCSGTGSINYQRWNNVSGTAVSALTSLSSYPNSPSQTGTRTLFEMPINMGNNFGVRMNVHLLLELTISGSPVTHVQNCG